MNLTEKEQKLLTLILNNAASDGEILNARKAFIRSIGSKNIFAKSYTNNSNNKKEEHKTNELISKFNKLRETAIKIEKERNDLYRQNQKNYKELLNRKEELKELKEELSRKKQIDRNFNIFSIFFGLAFLFLLYEYMLKVN